MGAQEHFRTFRSLAAASERRKECERSVLSTVKLAMMFGNRGKLKDVLGDDGIAQVDRLIRAEEDEAKALHEHCSTTIFPQLKEAVNG